jgi:hypothetical protein
MNSDIVDRTIDDFLSQIQEDAATSLWVLVDPTFCPEGMDAVTDQWIGLEHACHQPAISGYEMTSRNCPLWLGADLTTEAGRTLIQQTLGHALNELPPSELMHGRGRRVGGWVSAVDGATAAANMARLLVQRRADGHRTLVRLHDPAVLWTVWPTLHPAQRRAWMRGSERWWLLKPNAELMALHLHLDAPAPTMPATAGSHWASLELQDEQWHEVDAVTPFNTALRDWLTHCENSDADDAQDAGGLDALRDRALAALRQARRAGIDDMDAQVTVAFDAMKTFHDAALPRRPIPERIDHG